MLKWFAIGGLSVTLGFSSPVWAGGWDSDTDSEAWDTWDTFDSDRSSDTDTDASGDTDTDASSDTDTDASSDTDTDATSDTDASSDTDFSGGKTGADLTGETGGAACDAAGTSLGSSAMLLGLWALGLRRRRD